MCFQCKRLCFFHRVLLRKLTLSLTRHGYGSPIPMVRYQLLGLARVLPYLLNRIPSRSRWNKLTLLFGFVLRNWAICDDLIEARKPLIKACPPITFSRKSDMQQWRLNFGDDPAINYILIIIELSNKVDTITAIYKSNWVIWRLQHLRNYLWEVSILFVNFSVSQLFLWKNEQIPLTTN